MVELNFFLKDRNGLAMVWEICLIFPLLWNWIFQIFILSTEPFAKTLQSLKTCVLFDNELSKKLVSSLELPIKFDERFKVMSVLFFISNFNLLSCELDSFTFKMIHWVFSYWYYFKPKRLQYFHSSLLKN